MLNRHNLALAKLACREESRFTLNGILVTPKQTVVTDGHHLTMLTLPKMAVASFPEVPQVQGAPTLEFKPFVLSTLDALDILKNLPKKSPIPVLEHAAVFGQTFEQGCAKCNVPREHHGPIDGKERDHEFQESDRVDRTTLVVTDMERPKPYFAKALSGNFPDYDRILPQRSRNVFEIAMDPTLLIKCLEGHEALWEKNRGATCTLSFEAPDKAMQIFSEVNGQEMVSVVMPQRPGAGNVQMLQNATFERRKKLEEAAVEFKVALESRIEKSRYQFIGNETLRFYNHVLDLLFKEEVPEKIVAEAEVVEDKSEAEVYTEVGVDSGAKPWVAETASSHYTGSEEGEVHEYADEEEGSDEPDMAPDPLADARRELREKYVAMKQSKGKSMQQRMADQEAYRETLDDVMADLGEEMSLQLVDEIEQEGPVDESNDKLVAQGARFKVVEPVRDPIAEAKAELRPAYLATLDLLNKPVRERTAIRDAYMEVAERLEQSIGEAALVKIENELEQEAKADRAKAILQKEQDELRARNTPAGTVHRDRIYGMDQPAATNAGQQVDQLAQAMTAPEQGTKFTMSYGSTPVGGFTVPPPPAADRGPWTARMLRAETLDQAQVIMEHFEEAVNECERSADLQPSVGPGAMGVAYVGWPLISSQQRANMVVRAPNSHKDRLRALVMDGADMLDAYRAIQSKAQDAMRTRFGSPAPKTSGSSALAAKPAPTPVSGTRPDRPEDWNTMSAGKKAAWTRKYGKY